MLNVYTVGRKNESPQQFVLRISADKLAEHLSLVDMRIYRQIQPVELLGKVCHSDFLVGISRINR